MNKNKISQVFRRYFKITFKQSTFLRLLSDFPAPLSPLWELSKAKSIHEISEQLLRAGSGSPGLRGSIGLAAEQNLPYDIGR